MKLSYLKKLLPRLDDPSDTDVLLELAPDITMLVDIAVEAKRICHVLQKCEVKFVTDQLEEMIADLENP